MKPKAAAARRRSEKSAGLAYLLWALPGLIPGFSVHRFYLERRISALAQLAPSVAAVILIVAGTILATTGAGGAVDQMELEMIIMASPELFDDAGLLVFLGLLFYAIRLAWHIVDAFLIGGQVARHNEVTDV